MVARIALIIALLVPITGFAAERGKPTAADLCRRLTNVQDSGDVAYVPGKDVHGRKVAGANVEEGEPEVRLGDNITIQLGSNDFQQLNLPDNGVPYQPYMDLGEITVKKDGSVYFNGQRLTQPQVQSLCKDAPAATDSSSNSEKK